jgi:outer membrane protein OmpA-like peptidoglycan-associated protein
MKTTMQSVFPQRLALVVLASAIAVPSGALLAQEPAEQSAPAAVTQQAPETVTKPIPQAKEGFWGRVNPFARKKWVKRQTDPINDRLTELDQVNAKNANDIRDVDGRAQAGIRKAQGTADAANQLATAAGTQAGQANALVQGVHGRVDGLNATIGGLDSYKQTSELTVSFRAGSPVLTAAAKKKLDELAAGLSGKQGYILEIEAHAPQAGSAGIATSQRFAESVKRYLVTNHEIPVYRFHAVALGNAEAVNGSEKPSRSSHVQIRLMENSLAAQAAVSPQGTVVASGAERP